MLEITALVKRFGTQGAVDGISLAIPPGTSSGRTFRLKGQGMPRLKPKAGEAATGDLLVRVRVGLPTDLSDEARAAAERLVALADQADPRRDLDQ